MKKLPELRQQPGNLSPEWGIIRGGTRMMLSHWGDFVNKNRESPVVCDPRNTGANMHHRYKDRQALEYMERKYHLSEIDPASVTPLREVPTLRPETAVPERVVEFTDALREDDFGAWVHSCREDRYIDRWWNNPRRYLPRLKKFAGVFTPDFSMLLDMLAGQIHGVVVQSFLIGQICQREGIKVIPTAAWARRNTYDWCFDAIPERSTVVVSSVGVMLDKVSLGEFRSGLKELIERKAPTTLVFYGSIPALDFRLPPVVHFENTSTRWTRIGHYQPSLLSEVG